MWHLASEAKSPIIVSADLGIPHFFANSFFTTQDLSYKRNLNGTFIFNNVNSKGNGKGCNVEHSINIYFLTGFQHVRLFHREASQQN